MSTARTNAHEIWMSLVVGETSAYWLGSTWRPHRPDLDEDNGLTCRGAAEPTGRCDSPLAN